MLQPFLVRGKQWAQTHRLAVRVSAGVGVLALAIGLTPSLRASEPWQWRDLSQNIPSTVSSSLTLAAGRGEDWLASNGARLWSVSAAEEVTDYSNHSRNRGTLQQIATDGRDYLLAFQGGSGPSFTRTDLQTWSDMSDLRFPQQKLRAVSGDTGRWAILTDDQFDNSVFPRAWHLSFWDTTDSNTAPQTLTAPANASTFVPGCFKEVSNGTICAGQVAFLPINGQWFLFAGSAETRDANGRASQEGRLGIWRWNVDRFESVSNAPKARFVSGVWGGTNSVLLATTDAVTNPYAADTYWTFDGQSFKSYRSEPLEAGMFSVDTRSINAAWTGSAWAITAGKTLIQMQNGTFAVEGELRDLVEAVAGSTNGDALIVGERSEFDKTDGLSSRAPLLALLGSKLSSNDASYLIRPYNRYPSRIELAAINLDGDPTPTIINSGDSFTLRADATSASGIRSMDILVNGVRVSTCTGATCRYTQTHWNTDDQDPRERRVVFTAQVTDSLGRVTESRGLVLMVRKTLSATPAAINGANDENGLMPAGLKWKTDATSNIGLATWVTPSSSATTISNNETKTFHVAATQAGGINRIEIWNNGVISRTCSNNQQGGISFCSLTLNGSDSTFGSQLLLTARVVANDGSETWSQSARFDRF